MSYYDPRQRNPMGMQGLFCQGGPAAFPFSYMPQTGLTDVFLDEKQSFDDARLLQSFYPRMAQEIQLQVEEVCDQLEYEGSVMFDEYPDRLMIQKLTDDIYERVQKFWNQEAVEEAAAEALRSAQIQTQPEGCSSTQVQSAENQAESGNTGTESEAAEQKAGTVPMETAQTEEAVTVAGTQTTLRMQCSGCAEPPCRKENVGDFIRVLLLDEMHRRRCRHRRCRRFW